MKITLLSGSVVGTKTQTTMTIMQKKYKNNTQKLPLRCLI